MGLLCVHDRQFEHASLSDCTVLTRVSDRAPKGAYDRTSEHHQEARAALAAPFSLGASHTAEQGVRTEADSDRVRLDLDLAEATFRVEVRQRVFDQTQGAGVSIAVSRSEQLVEKAGSAVTVRSARTDGGR
ncbi:hypothetical protein AB838_07475 [Rhodobacteraceae bacterium (ex Bugula neritina AB1)]|nr:hypothetical protein AB838_07475 [Rhodobacteraceae bacterium (ex Bugula neritina AB1)]